MYISSSLNDTVFVLIASWWFRTIHCTPSRSLLVVHSFYTPVQMTHQVLIKWPFLEHNPHGICNFAELSVFAYDSIRVI